MDSTRGSIYRMLLLVPLLGKAAAHSTRAVHESCINATPIFAMNRTPVCRNNSFAEPSRSNEECPDGETCSIAEENIPNVSNMSWKELLNCCSSDDVRKELTVRANERAYFVDKFCKEYTLTCKSHGSEKLTSDLDVSVTGVDSLNMIETYWTEHKNTIGLHPNEYSDTNFYVSPCVDDRIRNAWTKKGLDFYQVSKNSHVPLPTGDRIYLIERQYALKKLEAAGKASSPFNFDKFKRAAERLLTFSPQVKHFGTTEFWESLLQTNVASDESSHTVSLFLTVVVEIQSGVPLQTIIHEETDRVEVYKTALIELVADAIHHSDNAGKLEKYCIRIRKTLEKIDHQPAHAVWHQFTVFVDNCNIDTLTMVASNILKIMPAMMDNKQKLLDMMQRNMRMNDSYIMYR